MDNYDDVRQFIAKVGEQNLNYRSFQTSMPCSGQSKWQLINQVKNYKHPASTPVIKRAIASEPAAQLANNTLLHSLAAQTPAEQAAASPEPQAAFYAGRRASFQPAQHVAKPNPFRRQTSDNDVAHLHKRSQQQPQADVQSANTESLAALFYRIAL